MPAITEDTVLIRQALAYVIELYRELTEENGAPTLGTQNQVVDFILADPELRAAVARLGSHRRDATRRRPRRRGGLPCDAAYRRIRAYLEAIMEQPVFTRPGPGAALIGADFRPPARYIGRNRTHTARRRPCRASTSFRGSISPRSTTRSPG